MGHAEMPVQFKPRVDAGGTFILHRSRYERRTAC
jgi:hypothetical protein